MRFLRLLLVSALSAGCLHAQAVQRPAITGIAHVSYFVSSLPKALDFWHGLLGFQVVATQDAERPGRGLAASVIIHPGQRVELFEGERLDPPGRMRELCFTVSDLKQMRSYLRAQKIAFTAVVVDGQQELAVEAPDRVRLEFVQGASQPQSAQAKDLQQADERISTGIFHVGFAVSDSVKALDFYGKVLGFRETWRGSADGKQLSWINMRVPDGTDYIEFMLKPATDAKGLGSQNHVSLAVPNMEAAVAKLKASPAFARYPLPVVIRTGIDRKRQVNLFDPDGTRVELMEPFTVDGKPAVSSTAPVPAL
jgi:catechol 2,3-dioxygenase-like lactoylglutathione lyase family enzyme